MGGWNRGLTKLEHPTLARWSTERRGIHYSRATEIKVGQRISPQTEFRKGNIPLHKIWFGKRIDTRPSSSLAYIIGVLLGDGCVSKSKRPHRMNSYRYQIILSVVDKAFAESFQWALESIGLHGRLSLRKYNDGHRQNQWVVTSINKPFCDWFLKCRNDYDYWYHYLGNHYNDFIRGFYESEGSIQNQYPTITMTNTDPALIKIVFQMCTAIGLTPTLQGPYKQKNPKWKDFYRIRIPARESQLFLNKVRPVIKTGGGGKKS